MDVPPPPSGQGREPLGVIHKSPPVIEPVGNDRGSKRECTPLALCSPTEGALGTGGTTGLGSTSPCAVGAEAATAGSRDCERGEKRCQSLDLRTNASLGHPCECTLSGDQNTCAHLVESCRGEVSPRVYVQEYDVSRTPFLSSKLRRAPPRWRSLTNQQATIQGLGMTGYAARDQATCSWGHVLPSSVVRHGSGGGGGREGRRGGARRGV